MTATISARIDPEKKKQAEALFSSIGLSLSSAINLFICAAIDCQGIPFDMKRRGAGERETLDAMAEARRLAKDPTAKRYSDVDELFADALK